MLTINPFIEQQTLHINPTNEDRTPTNSSFITVFYIIIFFWLLTIVIAFSNAPTNARFLGEEFSLEVIHELYPRFSWKFPLGLILSGLISFTYIGILSQDSARYIVHFMMFCLYCLIFVIVISVILTIRSISNDWEFTNLIIVQLISSVLITVYLVEILICTCSVGPDPIFRIIRDACRALLCCPMAISAFIFLMSVIIIITFIFSVYITMLVFFTRSNQSIINLFTFINLYCTIVVLTFLINFTQIVISGYVMDWFWSKDPNVSYTITIKRSLGRILNYHMGSVAFYSIPPLPILWSFYQGCRSRDNSNDIVKHNNIFTGFFSHFCVFVRVVDFGMIQTSIYGYDGAIAIMTAHDLVSQNNHEFHLAVCGISDMVIGFGLCLISMPSAFENILFCAYGLVIPFYMMLVTAIRTLLVNRMIINYTSEAFRKEYYNANPATVL